MFCPNKESGCDWQGELGQLDQHLNVNPNKHELGAWDRDYKHQVHDWHSVDRGKGVEDQEKALSQQVKSG